MRMGMGLSLTDIPVIAPRAAGGGGGPVSSAVLYSAGPDANRSQYVNVTGSGLIATLNDNIGDTAGVVAVLAMPVKAHFECKITGLAAVGPGTRFHLGVVDSSVAFGPNIAFTPRPGNGTTPGFDLDLRETFANGDAYANGSQSIGYTLPAAPDLNDVVAFDVDTTARTIRVSFFDASATSTTVVGTYTLTSNFPTTWRAFVGGTHLNQQITCNFGAAAWIVTPQTGHVGW